MEANRVIAIIGKTEGNGGVNDYTRIIADRAFREVLVDQGRRRADQVKQVPIVWSGGTDGVISPHATIFATVPADQAEQSDEPRLTVGFAMSERDPARGDRLHRDGHQGRRRGEGRHGAGRHHRPGRRALRADQDAAADDPHHPRREVARQDRLDRAHPRVDGPLQRHAPALGIAVALGEIEMPTDADVMHDRSLFSSVASCSSGVELDQAQVVVVGNARGVGGRYRIGHSVMRDALDADGIWAAIKDAGLDLPERPHPATCRAGWSTSSSSARSARTARCRPPQRDARRLRRALAPADQVVRRRRHRRGDRRPGGLRVGVGRPPGPRRRRPGRGDRRPRRGRADRLPLDR